MKGLIDLKLVFLFAVCVCCARSLPTDIPICSNVKAIFESRNMSARITDSAVDGNSLTVCRAERSCCTLDMESNFKSLIRKEYRALLQHNVQSVQGILASTATDFQDYVRQMLLKAERKTLQILNSAFGSVSTSTDQTVKAFFDDLNQYVNNGTVGLESGDAASRVLPSVRSVSPDNRLAHITNTLFVRIFPLIYQTTLAPRQRELHPDYRTCLQEHIGDIKPFSEITKMLEKDVSKTFEATRVLIASLNFGSQLLNQSNEVILSTLSGQGCYDALLKMTFCNHCNGHGINVKPCSGYCLNVMRGCLSQPAAEMDSSWNGFYEALDKLISLVNRGQSLIGLEDLLKSLHSRIAEPILHFSEQHLNVVNRAKNNCGPVRWMNSTNDGSEKELADQKDTFGVVPGVVVSTKLPGNHPDWKLDEEDLNVRSNLLTRKIQQFKESVSKSRSFYANLADTLCADDSFAEKRESAPCWNGQRVAEYMKTVLSIALTSQKYNPEVSWVAQAVVDSRITDLTERLRHMKQLVLNQVVMNPESDSLHQMDDDGSGSGAGPVPYDDEDAGQESPNYSGSGDDSLPITNVPDDVNRDNNDLGLKTRVLFEPSDTTNQTETKTTGSSDRSTWSSLLLCISVLLAYKQILHLS